MGVSVSSHPYEDDIERKTKAAATASAASTETGGGLIGEGVTAHRNPL